MTYTAHGHHIPGTTFDDEAGQVAKARCGGPGLCSDCSKDLAQAHRFELPDTKNMDEFDDPESYNDEEFILKKAKLFVVGAYNNRVDKDEQEISARDLRVLQFFRIDDDWKVLLETKDPNDPIDFLVTHIARELTTVVVTYMKITTDSFSQEGSITHD